MSSSSHEHKSDDNEGNNLRKGQWTEEEDAILAAYVTQHGPGNWNIVQQRTGLLRCGKSCRLRWTNHLRPDLRRGAFTKEEQNKVIELHAKMGNKWAKMTQELPGRTDNEIKNFWNTRLKKRKRIGLGVYPEGVQPVFDAHNSETSLTTYTHRDSEVVGTSSEHAMLNNSGNIHTQNQPLRVPPISIVFENMNLSVKPEEKQMYDVQLPEACTSSSVPHVVFNNSNNNSQNQPLYAQPIFQELHDFDRLPRGWMYDDYAEPPPWPPSCDDCAELPPFLPSCDDYAELPPFPPSCDDYAKLPPLSLSFAESLSLRENYEDEKKIRYYESRSPRSNGYLETMFYPPKVSKDEIPMQGELNLGNSREISDQKKPQDEDDDLLGELIWIENQHGPYKDSSCGYVHPFLKP